MVMTAVRATPNLTPPGAPRCGEVGVSIVDMAARSVRDGGGHRSKSAVAALVAVASPVIAVLAWLAPDRTLGFSLFCTALCTFLSACSGLMYFAHRRYWADGQERECSDPLIAGQAAKPGSHSSTTPR